MTNPLDLPVADLENRVIAAIADSLCDAGGRGCDDHDGDPECFKQARAILAKLKAESWDEGWVANAVCRCYAIGGEGECACGFYGHELVDRDDNPYLEGADCV